MKKRIIPFFICIFITFCVKPAYSPAVITVQAGADGKVNLSFEFANVNITAYQLIRNKSLITDSTIPNTIINQTQLAINYSSNVSFDDSTSSISAVIDLYGSGVLNSTLNMNRMTKVFSLRTSWRKFKLNITDGFCYDFVKYFETPIVQWRNYTDEGRICFVHSYEDAGLSFSFKLPKSAKNVHIAEDNETIIFEFSLPKGDNLLNSPFLILIVVVVANIVAFVYRKIRKGIA